MKATHFPVPHNLKTLPALVQYAAKYNAKKKCLTRLLPNSLEQVSYTFIDFFRMASLLAEAFNNNNSLEIRKDDKIAVYASPCPEIPVILLAAAVYNLNVLLISPDLSQPELDSIYLANPGIKATFTTVALQQNVQGEKIFLDDDPKTRLTAVQQPEFKPPKKMLFQPVSDSNFDENSQIINSDTGTGVEGNYASYVNEPSKDESQKLEKSTLQTKSERLPLQIDLPSILMKNTFHTFISYVADDLGVFQEKNPLYDNYLINILHYEMSQSDENAPFLTIFNSVQGHTVTQKQLTSQIVKLARTRLLKQRLQSSDEERHKECTYFVDVSAVNVIVMFAALLNGAAVVFCDKSQMLASIDMAHPTYLYLPLACKGDFLDILRRNGKLNLQANEAVINSAQFTEVKQFCTTEAVYPLTETCQNQIGGQLRVLLVEALSEEEHKQLTAYLNCVVLSYMCQPNGLFLTVQSIFSHHFGQVGENFTDQDFAFSDAADGLIPEYGIRAKEVDGCLYFEEFDRAGSISAALKQCCEDKFNLVCDENTQIVLIDKRVSGNIDGYTIEIMQKLNARLQESGIKDRISMVVFCVLCGSVLENVRYNQRLVEYALNLKPGFDVELACQELKRMGFYQ